MVECRPAGAPRFWIGAAHVPKGTRFCLPSVKQLTVASTADGANTVDASALGELGPSLAV